MFELYFAMIFLSSGAMLIFSPYYRVLFLYTILFGINSPADEINCDVLKNQKKETNNYNNSNNFIFNPDSSHHPRYICRNDYVRLFLALVTFFVSYLVYASKFKTYSITFTIMSLLAYGWLSYIFNKIYSVYKVIDNKKIDKLITYIMNFFVLIVGIVLHRDIFIKNLNYFINF